MSDKINSKKNKKKFSIEINNVIDENDLYKDTNDSYSNNFNTKNDKSKEGTNNKKGVTDSKEGATNNKEGVADSKEGATNNKEGIDNKEGGTKKSKEEANSITEEDTKKSKEDWPNEDESIKNESIDENESLFVDESMVADESTDEPIGNHLNESTDKTDALQYELLRTPSNRYVKWSNKEIKCLLDGFNKYGCEWTRILEENKDIFNKKRRFIDLKLKHDLINKKSSFYISKKRNWVQLLKNSIKTDELGEEIIINQKFPYDAAKKFAKLENEDFGVCYFLTVAEKDDLSNNHTYEIQKGNFGNITIRKVKPKIEL